MRYGFAHANRYRLYYFQGCPSWTWYYPYHYAPFAADFVDMDKMDIKFDKGRTFKPFEQLMGVMPAASDHTLPEIFRPLMSDPESPIIDFYPTEFPIDLNGKKFAWQGVALLPFIDETRLLEAMATKYPMLSAADAARNEKGKDVLIMSEQHPLYEEIATNFYSKRQNSPNFKLDPRISQGLAGTVEKNEDYLPQSSLVFPLDETDMPGLEEDHSIRYATGQTLLSLANLSSVHFEMPKSTYAHKSMLLRGVKLAPPVLDRSDIEATKGRANKSGRSFGGAPLRGGSGRGRGGQFSYADQRPNPFAAHLNPAFGGVPTGSAGSHGQPPYGENNYGRGPPSQNYGHGPPPNGQYNRPPPPSNGYYNGQAPYSRGPPPPPSGYYGGPPPPSIGYGNVPPRPPPSQYPPYGSNNSYRGQQDGYYGGR